MSTLGAAVILGAVIAMLLKLKALRLGPALACVVFGLVLAATSVGHALVRGLTGLGGWLWGQVSQL